MSSFTNKHLELLNVHRECAPQKTFKFYGWRSTGQNYIKMKYLMIISHLPFFIYIPHIPTIFTKGYFTKSAHIALSVIKMNCWCAWVQLHKCANSDGTMPISKRMPSLRRMFLSLMHFPRVQSWQRSATLNWSQTWHMKTSRNECAKVNIRLSWGTWLHQDYSLSLIILRLLCLLIDFRGIHQMFPDLLDYNKYR